MQECPYEVADRPNAISRWHPSIFHIADVQLKRSPDIADAKLVFTMTSCLNFPGIVGISQNDRETAFSLYSS